MLRRIFGGTAQQPRTEDMPPAVLKVLHVGKYYPPYRGGMESFLADLVEQQRASGIDARAVVHGDPLPDDPPWLIRVPVQVTLVFAPIAVGFPLALHQARRFRAEVGVSPLPFAPLSRSLSLVARAGVFRDIPALIASQLRQLVRDEVLSPALADWPWLREQLQIL